MQERALAERLITYDTSTLDGIRAAAGFVKGWLESHEIEVRDGAVHDLPVLAATVGAESGPTIVLHGHIDVVPGHPEQFQPRIEGDRLLGRGAYDMKGGLAGMMCAVRDLAAQADVRVHFVCVSDEESDEPFARGSDYVVAKGYVGDFAITGEPTDLRLGVQSKGGRARGGRDALDAAGPDLGRARRRLGRDQLPGRRRAGRRVRAHRRRASRSRRVGLDRIARSLPRSARGVRELPPPDRREGPPAHCLRSAAAS